MRYSFVDQSVAEEPVKFIVTAGRKGKFITLRRDTFEAANNIKRKLWRLGFVATVEKEV